MHARIGWQNLRTSEFLDSGNYMLITGTDFNDGAINFSTCHYVERERYEQDRNIQIHNGSILITKDGTLGKVAYVQGLSMPATLNAGVFNVQIKDANNVDEKYLFQYLKAPFLMDYVDKKATGGTIKHLNQSILVDFPVILPQRSEQTLIGAFFQQLDNLITLHQRQPFLQSPPDISLIVQLTPPFYTFSWEQRKLASLCEKFTDGDWIESKDQSDFGVRLVQTGNVGVAEYLDKTNNKKWISEDTFDRLHCEEVLPGDILISRLPEPAGRACIVPLLGTKMITAVDCTIVRTAPDMSNKFLVQYLSSQAYFDDVNTCLAGGTRQRISRGNLANFNVPIPVKKSEQDAIGMFFGYLDNLITLHQRQTIVYAVIRSIRKVILAERQYFAPPMVRKSP